MNSKLIKNSIKEENALRAKNSYHASIKRGIKYLDSRQYAQAIPEYKEALRIDPSSAVAHRNIGYAYERTGKPKLAMEHYDKAIILDDKYSTAYADRGRLYKRRGEKFFTKALEDFTLAILHDDKNIYAYYNRSSLFSEMGLEDAARKDEESIKQLKSQGSKKLIEQNIEPNNS